ncbi:MAG: arylsulfatase [Planctomycetota bacterium]|nr:MAG: arylsulfatase [Planctomycetota bacterium]
MIQLFGTHRAIGQASDPVHRDWHRPNILLILADDLGYGDLSCYNPESKVATPNLDRLATEGMRFTDAHSPSTVCTPTRYSILTGRMAFRTGFRGVFDGVGGPCLIEPNRLTLGALLQGLGYRTAMHGKWHVGLTFFDAEGNPICQNGLKAVQRVDFTRPIPDAPIHRGFDRFFGTACCPTTDWLYAYIDGDRIPVPPTDRLDPSHLPKHAYSVDNRRGLIAADFDLERVDLVFLERSKQFLREHAAQTGDQPFFLFHSMQAVHLPSFPAPEFQGRSGAGPHGDFILEMDAIVGELLAELDSLGLRDDTLVLFTSDNGPEVSTVYHMRKDHGHDGARPWRGVKRDQWEGGHRVPLIVRWPQEIPAGETPSATVCLTDIVATIADITGANLSAISAEDSMSMWPVLNGSQPQGCREYTLHQTIRLDLAIRHGKWKYLDHRGSGGNNYDHPLLREYALPDTAPDAPGQLYDLSTDPGETTNLYFEHPEIVERLKKKLEAFKSSGRSVPADHGIPRHAPDATG